MKAKIKIFIFLSVILIIPLFSQVTFNRTYFNSVRNNIGNCIIGTNDSCFVIAGELNSDAFLMKIDQAGDTIWTKTYGGDERDNAKSLVQLPDSGFIFTGYTESQGGMWLVGTDLVGDTLWTKVFSEYGEGQQIIETLDGNYVITGTTPDPGSVNGWMCDTSDTYCMKINQSGDMLWQNRYDLGLSEIGFSVCETADSALAISLCEGVKLLKLNTEGDTLWHKEYTHNSVSEDHFPGIGYSIISTADEGYLITGMKIKTFPEYCEQCYAFCGWLIKIDRFGDTLWTNTFIKSTSTNGVTSIETQDGDFISLFNCEGISFDGVKIIKTSNNGIVLEESTVPLDYATSIIECPDSSFIITGKIDDYISVVKIDTLEPVIITNINYGEVCDFTLAQNYPNPFNPITTISYSVKEYSKVKLMIYNISGQLIETLIDEYQPAGVHSIKWNASKYSSGIYFYRLEYLDIHATRKMLLIK